MQQSPGCPGRALWTRLVSVSCMLGLEACTNIPRGNFYFMHMNVLPPCVYNACRGQKKASELCKLELQLSVSHHVFWKSASGKLKEQPGLLNTGSSFQPQEPILSFSLLHFTPILSQGYRPGDSWGRIHL